MPQAARRIGMDFDERLRLGRGKLRHAAGLRPGLVVRQHAAGGEEERVVLVGLLGGAAILDRMEPRASVVGGEAFEEQARRAGMGLVRAGPEHAVFGDRSARR